MTIEHRNTTEIVSETYAVFGGVAFRIGSANARLAQREERALVRAMRAAGESEALCYVQGTETLTVYPASPFRLPCPEFRRERRAEARRQAHLAAVETTASPAKLLHAAERHEALQRHGASIAQRVSAENRIHELRRALGLAQWAPLGSALRGVAGYASSPTEGLT